MNFWKPSSLILTLIASLSLNPAISNEKIKQSNTDSSKKLTFLETLSNKKENLIANSSLNSFSDPQPRFKDDINRIPTNSIAKFESTRLELKEYELYSRYKNVRENLLNSGWVPNEKRRSKMDAFFDDYGKTGSKYNPNRVCSITDPKKQRELDVDLSGNIKKSSMPMTIAESNKPKKYPLYFSKATADASVIMDECLYPETHDCNYGSGTIKNIPEIWCRMEWVRKSGSYPTETTESITLSTAKLLPTRSYQYNYDSFFNSGNPCIWGIPGKSDEGSSNHCLTSAKYSMKYIRPSVGDESFSYTKGFIHTDILKEIKKEI